MLFFKDICTFVEKSIPSKSVYNSYLIQQPPRNVWAINRAPYFSLVIFKMENHIVIIFPWNSTQTVLKEITVDFERT